MNGLNWDDILDYLRTHLPHILPGVLLAVGGMLAGWLLARWRRYRLLRQVEGGDAREMVILEQILVKEQPDGHVTMRIRSCGSQALRRILINPVGFDAFLHRVHATTPTNPLIDMRDQMGSYLLHLLQPWVCGLARSGPFPHDTWVMCPVCEPGHLSVHQSTTILLVRQKDLDRFLDWQTCKHIHVEHGADGARILTLWHMAREFHKQLADVQNLRAQGKRTTFAESMYILDLGLDTQEVPLRTKPVPWERFAPILKALNLG